MTIKRAACLAFTAACLTGIATLPAAHAQMANRPPGGDSGGNSMGLYGPNPGGPGLTPYSGGAPGAKQPYPSYATAPGAYGAKQPYPSYATAPGAYGATQPYPDYPAPSAAGTSNTETATNSSVTYPAAAGMVAGAQRPPERALHLATSA